MNDNEIKTAYTSKDQIHTVSGSNLPTLNQS